MRLLARPLQEGHDTELAAELHALEHAGRRSVTSSACNKAALPLKVIALS